MTPDTTEDLAENVGAYDRARTPLHIAGGNTLHGMGRSIAGAHETLSTAKLNRIVEDAATDLVVCAQAGVTLRNLSIALAKHGTHVPFDAPLSNTATLGGTLAAGWIGPRRHIYGRPRDYLIGSVAVLADGTIARAGGIVVKNVSGYDMSRLYVGSFGTLAILTQANLKTFPQSQAARMFVARAIEGSRARAMAVLSTLAVAPSAAFWVEGFHTSIDGDDGAEGRLLVFLEGSDAVLERATRDLRSALGRAGVPETQLIDAGARASFERVVDAYIACVGERSITYRVAATPGDSEIRMQALRALTATFEMRVDSLVDVMNGDMILRVSDLDARALGAKIEMFDDALHDAEPHARIVAGNHSARERLNVWGERPPAFEQMRALKARFDPNGTLNPGRFVGGI